jgi:uncharacterized protein (TIGR01244 family)
MKNWRILGVFGVVALLPLVACVATRSDEPAGATATPREVPAMVVMAGVGNCYRVTDRLYRSEQPEAAGMANLAKAGVTTVINLRANHDDAPVAAGTSLKLVHVPIDTWNLSDGDVVAVMRAVESAPGPVLIHCQHGADRTGTMIAMYRILYQGWSKEEALAEMTGERFGYHAIWGNLPKYIRGADLDKLRAAIAAK